ncbi:MAG: hypothetical protein Cpurp_10885 [Chlorogloea purpurea SAG 13.99]|nr:hypothetical protein [Chlorogloea purpurea SAG 13.99]
MIWLETDFSEIPMYNKNTDKDLLGAGITAALGAGIITSFAVGQGQDIFTALGITVLAALCGIICRQLDIL